MAATQFSPGPPPPVTGPGRPAGAVPLGARPGRFGTPQLVAVELAGGGLAAALFAGRPAYLVVVGVLAGVLLIGALVRRDGRWMYESLALRRRLGRRRRAVTRVLGRPGVLSGAPVRPAPPRAAGTAVGVASVGALARRDTVDDGATPRAGVLAALAPALGIRAVTDRGTVIGVGTDRAGWFAAAVVAPWSGLSGAREAGVPLARLARLLAEGAVPVSTLAVVTHRVGAPAAGIPAHCPAARSYAELTGAAPVPANQDSWIAVRLEPRDAAAAAADRGGGVAGVDRALATTLARLGAVLQSAGVGHRVLDAGGLRHALTVSCGLGRAADGAAVIPPVAGAGPTGPAPVAEQWSGWLAAGLVHVCFAVHGWPAAAPPELLGALPAVPQAVAVDTAVLLRRPDPEDSATLALRLLVRLVAEPDRLADCVGHLRTVAAGHGARLTRLDGEHALGVYATAPTAANVGSAPW